MSRDTRFSAKAMSILINVGNNNFPTILAYILEYTNAMLVSFGDLKPSSDGFWHGLHFVISNLSTMLCAYSN